MNLSDNYQTGHKIVVSSFWRSINTATNKILCWEATETGGLEMGPRFSFKMGHCNLKKSALFFISFENTLLLCYCYIFVIKIENGMSLS